MSEREYKELVLAAYEQKQASGQLVSELLSPKPARIKAESVRLCEQRYRPGDENILRSFFGNKDGKAGYLNAIKNCNAEIFKPVITFFLEKKLSSNLKNAEYLAWLLDFPARPYHPDLQVPDVPNQQKIKSETARENELSAKTTIVRPEDGKPPKAKKQSLIALLVAGLVLVIGLCAYLFFEHQPKHYTGKEGCMIWNNDHYEPADCNDHSSGNILYPIKHELVDHFKKITDPTTVSLASVGKAWYAKYNGNVEFFTDSGPYPLDTNRRVLPMTIHIYQKYILHTSN